MKLGLGVSEGFHSVLLPYNPSFLTGVHGLGVLPTAQQLQAASIAQFSTTNPGTSQSTSTQGCCPQWLVIVRTSYHSDKVATT